MIVRFLLFVILLFSHVVAFSQQGVKRSYTSYNHLWFGLDYEQKLTDRVKVGLDVPYRRQSVRKGSLKLYEALHYYGFRLWSTFRVSDQFRVSISPIAYFYEVPTTNEYDELDRWQDEIRFSLRLYHAPEGTAFTHRYGLERRYRRDYENNRWREFRLRYMLRFNKEISRSYRFIMDDEIFINMGRSIGYNIFDMNRLFVGIRKEVWSDVKLTAGYQNILEQLSSGEEFNVIHALTFTISVNSGLSD